MTRPSYQHPAPKPKKTLEDVAASVVFLAGQCDQLKERLDRLESAGGHQQTEEV